MVLTLLTPQYINQLNRLQNVPFAIEPMLNFVNKCQPHLINGTIVLLTHKWICPDPKSQQVNACKPVFGDPKSYG